MPATKRAPLPGAAPAVPPPAACACGCSGDAAEGRQAVAVDPDAKARNLARLRRIEGQVRGVQRMIEADRYCADVLTQVSAVQEALRAVSRELLRNHLKHCATAALAGPPAEREAMVDELVDLMARQGR